VFDKCLLCSVGSIWVCLGLSGSRSRSSLGSLSPEAERGRKEGEEIGTRVKEGAEAEGTMC